MGEGVSGGLEEGDGSAVGASGAAAASTEEAVLNALCMATAVTGPGGLTRPLLADWLAGR